MQGSYQHLDHTGDLGVEVWGESWEALLHNASAALTDTLVDHSQVEVRQTVNWKLRADSLESLMVRQLEEILFQFDARGMIFAEFRIKKLAETQIECTAEGEPLDREKHHFKTEIKAVTYHQLKITREADNHWKARIIFDV